MNTRQWIDFTVSETETSLALLYSYMQFHYMLGKQENVDAMNTNPEFWMLHNGAVQRSLFLYLGRIADDSKDGKSFADFKRHCLKNTGDFTHKEFLKRRPGVLKLNPTFLDGKVEPSSHCLDSLFKLASPHNSFLRGACKAIRSRVFAHAILTEEHEYSNLFSQVSLDKIEAALLAYWSISKHVWECFHNARTIDLVLLEYPEKDSIFKNTTRAVLGPSN